MILAVVLVALALFGVGALVARHLVVAAAIDRDTWRARTEHEQQLAAGRAEDSAELRRLAAENWQAERAELLARVDALQATPALRLEPEQARALREEIEVPSPVMPGVLGNIKSTVWDQQKCQHCGGLHNRSCPRVRRIAYTDSGKPSEVEFWPEGRWPADEVIWLEDVIEAAAEEVSGER